MCSLPKWRGDLTLLGSCLSAYTDNYCLVSQCLSFLVSQQNLCKTLANQVKKQNLLRTSQKGPLLLKLVDVYLVLKTSPAKATGTMDLFCKRRPFPLASLKVCPCLTALVWTTNLLVYTWVAEDFSFPWSELVDNQIQWGFIQQINMNNLC